MGPICRMAPFAVLCRVIAEGVAMKCKAYSCEREVKAMGLCHVHLKAMSKPPLLSIGHSDFTRWQKNAALERSWKKAATEEHRHARARRKRTSALDNATPHWLSAEQQAAIKATYAEARRMSQHGEKYEVDHIVPLHGAVVCGLHVPWNLRILSKAENNKRGNRDFSEAVDGKDLEA